MWQAENLALVALTFLVAGFVKGIVGLGLPTISVGVMTATIGLQPALALVVAPAIATNLWQGLSGGHFRELLRRHWPFFLAATLCTWIGVAIVVWAASPLLPLVLATSLILHSSLSLMKVRLPMPSGGGHALGVVMGGATGVLMGMTGSGSVPSVYYLDTLGLDRNRFVQAMGILFVLLTAALGASLAERSAFDPHMIWLSIGALLPTFFGVYAGQRLRRRMSETAFRKTLYLSLMALGVVIIVRTLMRIL